jgi:transcriptional regulator with XRE-family HTH domain
MNRIDNSNSSIKEKNEYLELLNDFHVRSGLSLREVAQRCDIDPTYVHYILKGTRRPKRDVIIALGYAYNLERMEVDEILLLAGLPPIGRSVLRQFRKAALIESGHNPTSDSNFT